MRAYVTGLLIAMTMLVGGCATRAASTLSPAEFGLPQSIEELADQFDRYDVFASRDRATTTALVFDIRGDDWVIEPWGAVWRKVGSRDELMEYISEMRWAYGQGSRLRAIGAPEGQGAAGLVFSPAPVATSAEGRTITVRDVSLSEACRFGTVYFGSGPCIEAREERRF